MGVVFEKDSKGARWTKWFVILEMKLKESIWKRNIYFYFCAMMKILDKLYNYIEDFARMVS